MVKLLSLTCVYVGFQNQVMKSPFKTLPRVLLLASAIVIGVGVIRYVSR